MAVLNLQLPNRAANQRQEQADLEKRRKFALDQLDRILGGQNITDVFSPDEAVKILEAANRGVFEIPRTRDRPGVQPGAGIAGRPQAPIPLARPTPIPSIASLDPVSQTARAIPIQGVGRGTDIVRTVVQDRPKPAPGPVPVFNQTPQGRITRALTPEGQPAEVPKGSILRTQPTPQRDTEGTVKRDALLNQTAGLLEQALKGPVRDPVNPDSEFGIDTRGDAIQFVLFRGVDPDDPKLRKVINRFPEGTVSTGFFEFLGNLGKKAAGVLSNPFGKAEPSIGTPPQTGPLQVAPPVQREPQPTAPQRTAPTGEPVFNSAQEAENSGLPAGTIYRIGSPTGPRFQLAPR